VNLIEIIRSECYFVVNRKLSIVFAEVTPCELKRTGAVINWRMAQLQEAVVPSVKDVRSLRADRQ